MCTCINLKTKDQYFGRNLDLEYRFNEKVVITPRNYNIKNIDIKYAMIGMATVSDDYPLYAEAANEKGLAMAGLYFPNNAYYNEPMKNKINLAPYEFILYILGNFKSVKEVKEIINDINITNVKFNNLPLADLHWMISDDKDCIVVEQVKEGLKVYDNKIGVLTNNPQFSYHLTNINNYINLSSKNRENTFSDKINLSNYGQGMGAIGLPGDNSPASRFVRVAFNKLNSVCNDDEESSVTQFFHILDSVAMIKGSVITKENNYDITTYSSCINTTKGIYYYKTYNNNQITAIKLNNVNMNDDKLSIYELIEKQQIKYINYLE